MTTETRPDYTTSGQESTGTASPHDHHTVDPQRWANVQFTIGGKMQFLDPDDPERWITSDTVTEVTR